MLREDPDRRSGGATPPDLLLPRRRPRLHRQPGSAPSRPHRERPPRVRPRRGIRRPGRNHARWPCGEPRQPKATKSRRPPVSWGTTRPGWETGSWVPVGAREAEAELPTPFLCVPQCVVGARAADSTGWDLFEVKVGDATPAMSGIRVRAVRRSL